MSADPEKPALFFATAAEFRAWLAAHHATERELWLGLYKKSSGRPSITYTEAVDQALCFGWIDGKAQTIDAISYRQRFTPRRPNSIWSNVNVAKVETLLAQGLMHPAGLRAYEARRPDRTGVYAFEQEPRALDPDEDAQVRANVAAAAFLDAQPASYRQVVTHWIASAKRPDTRQRRLAQLIDACERGERLPQFTSTTRRNAISRDNA
jgi:uncharacterized protein YdeI (YjbR/CyaY-like superfamily)